MIGQSGFWFGLSLIAFGLFLLGLLATRLGGRP